MSADAIFSVGSVLFILALLPAFRQPPAAPTGLLTGSVLAVYAATYATLDGFLYSTVTTGILAALWLALAVLALLRRGGAAA
jgi:hypothetical protein